MAAKERRHVLVADKFATARLLLPLAYSGPGFVIEMYRPIASGDGGEQYLSRLVLLRFRQFAQLFDRVFK
jgi:hypothetical protein